MGIGGVLELVEPMEWLTIGLVIFAGAQVWLQVRAERQRMRERAADRDENVDRAFHLAWAEHFRLDGLADDLQRRDLIEMAYLDVLDPQEVLPRDWGRLTEALAGLSREAGVLGGVAVALCHDVERATAILVNSVRAFAREAPPDMRETEKVSWLREQFGEVLSQWEEAVRKGVTELSLLMWDAAKHNPRASLERRLEFSDDLSSGLAKAAVGAFVKRASGAAQIRQGSPTNGQLASVANKGEPHMDSWGMSQEREFMENLTNQRFNFFLAFFSAVVAGGIVVENQLHLQIVLSLGALISLLLGLTVYRANFKLGLILDIIFDQADHPVTQIESIARERKTALFSVRWITGWFVPAACCTLLILGAVLSLTGVLKVPQ